MNKLTDFFRRHSLAIQAIVVWGIVIVLLGFVGAMLEKYLEYSRLRNAEYTRLLISYVQEHQCERAGFVGRDPGNVQPYYKCNNGMFLTSEIVAIKSLQEEQKTGK